MGVAITERDEADRLLRFATHRESAHTPDTLNRDGALALAKRLQEYWHGRGYPAARFWAEPVAERFTKIGTYEIYRVGCNFVNGMPPRYRDDPG
jgi:hypothetical protein